MSRAPMRHGSGDPTAALGGAAGAAVIGILAAIVLPLRGVASVPGLAGAVVAVIAAVGYARARSRVAGDIALAALAVEAFYLVLLLALALVYGWLSGSALQDQLRERSSRQARRAARRERERNRRAQLVGRGRSRRP